MSPPAARLLARAAIAAAGTELGLRTAGRVRGAIGPLDVSARLQTGRGSSVHVPPLGSARLRTHRGPLHVDVTVEQFDAERAAAVLGESGPLDNRLRAAAADARTLVTALAARAAAAGVGGAVALAAVTLRRPRDIAATGAISAAALLAAGALAAGTLERPSVDDAELDGLLAHAPQVLGDLRQAPERLALYRDQLAELLRTGTAVHRRVTDLPEPPPADSIRLVHVSDIHLSPLALPLARVLVEQYGADAVLDTGDLVDWGTPAESGALAAGIPSLGVPYVYIKGNHDSAGTAAAVARQPNAVVLHAGDPPREIAGLRFAGMADPRFTPDKTTGDDHAPGRVRAAAREFAATLTAMRDSGSAPVDVALVHAPAAARPLAGLVPLVLAGDIHRREVRRLDGTTVLVQGSSGGSGLRGVQVDPPAPVMISVLFVERAGRRLWGVDEVTLDGLGGTGLHIARRRVADLLGDADAGAA